MCSKCIKNLFRIVKTHMRYTGLIVSDYFPPKFKKNVLKMMSKILRSLLLPVVSSLVERIERIC